MAGMRRWWKMKGMKFLLSVLASCLVCTHAELPQELFYYEEGIEERAGVTDKFNLTLEPYNFTQPNETEASTWGMRLFGRLLTPTPVVQRALSDMLYIIFDCGKCDPYVSSFQKKPYSSGGSWSSVSDSDYYKDPDYYAGGYFIINLTPNSEYMIRASLKSGHSVPAYGKTCDTNVPPVANLHVAKAAAAWFDVRWKPPNEKCNAVYYYKFNYISPDSMLYKNTRYANNITRFNMYWRNDSPGPRWIWDSFHPCPDYPAEVCLFIGEHVRPQSTYFISVKPTRFGTATWEEDGYFINITAHSNYNWDAFPPSFCPKSGDTVPLWVIILFVILILIVIVVIIVVAEMLRRQKKKDKAREAKEGDDKPKKKPKKKKGDEPDE